MLTVTKEKAVRKCQVTQCKKNQSGLCSLTYCAQYDLYREVTGKCPVCGQSVKTHWVCPACGGMTGPGHFEPALVKYRDHEVCDWCRRQWMSREKVLGKALSFEEYCRPDLIKEEKKRERVPHLIKVY